MFMYYFKKSNFYEFILFRLRIRVINMWWFFKSVNFNLFKRISGWLFFFTLFDRMYNYYPLLYYMIKKIKVYIGNRILNKVSKNRFKVIYNISNDNIYSKYKCKKAKSRNSNYIYIYKIYCISKQNICKHNIINYVNF